MIRLGQALHEDEGSGSLPEVEALLLQATHDLAATLGVEPEQALRALAVVIRRRADFERLKGAAKATSGRILR
ncbi:hypothetical protein [uncultured Bosea sp.]|uniref:hypothetical protein n=1 Tax=uncultured Bosea sp. TaxID=211457 RepID=UPI0025CF2E00|nr:hypothetical protein [uncultured Bosea sp.]